MTAASDAGRVCCLICDGSGCDPEPHVSQRCCGRGVGGECCGEPDMEMEQQPCRQCGGEGKIVPESLLAEAERKLEYAKQLLGEATLREIDLQAQVDAGIMFADVLEHSGFPMEAEQLRAALGET
jgi:DnaJ-class molecular chaperone